MGINILWFVGMVIFWVVLVKWCLFIIGKELFVFVIWIVLEFRCIEILCFFMKFMLIIKDWFRFLIIWMEV